MPLVGNIRDLGWAYDPETSPSPRAIDTPHLEVRVIILGPGQCPAYHAHHAEMDEGYLICQGRGLMNIDGERFEVGAGDMILGKRGGFHNMENTGDEDLIEFNFRGGKMPPGFIPSESGPPPARPGQGASRPEASHLGGGYLLGNLFDGTRRGAPKNERAEEIPQVFATEYLELSAFTREGGDKNEIHRHQPEMDEAALIARGEGCLHFHIDGEDIEAREGDLIHIPGGAWHRVRRVSKGGLSVLNFRGGKLPSLTQWGNEDE